MDHSAVANGVSAEGVCSRLSIRDLDACHFHFSMAESLFAIVSTLHSQLT
jgi:hypothetical protein